MKVANAFGIGALVIGAYLVAPWLFCFWVRLPPFAMGFGIVEQHFGSSRILSIATVLSLAYMMNRFTNLNHVCIGFWRRPLFMGAYFLIVSQLLFFYSLCTDYLVFLKIEERFVAIDDIDAQRYDSYLHAINQLIVPFGVRIDSFRGHYMVLSSLRHWGFRRGNVRVWEPWLYFTLSWVWFLSVSMGIYKGLVLVSKYLHRFFVGDTGLSPKAIIPVDLMRKAWTFLSLLVIFCNFRQTVVMYVEGGWGIWHMIYLGLGYVLLATLLGLVVFASMGWLWKYVLKKS